MASRVKKHTDDELAGYDVGDFVGTGCTQVSKSYEQADGTIVGREWAVDPVTGLVTHEL